MVSVYMIEYDVLGARFSISLQMLKLSVSQGAVMATVLYPVPFVGVGAGVMLNDMGEFGFALVGWRGPSDSGEPVTAGAAGMSSVASTRIELKPSGKL